MYNCEKGGCVSGKEVHICVCVCLSECVCLGELTVKSIYMRGR